MSFYFSPEIEESTLSLIWHDPEKLAIFEQRFSPDIFAQIHCRELVRAMHFAYQAVGSLDFASVIQCARELGSYDAIGGIDGADMIFRISEFSPRADLIFAHYLDMLDSYAAHRQKPIECYPFIACAIHRSMQDMADTYREQVDLRTRDDITRDS